MTKPFVFTVFFLVFMLSATATGYDYTPPQTPPTIVYVHPEEIEVKLGETFMVDVDVSDVRGLQGLDLILTYNTKILDGLDVVEGPFMASGGETFAAKMEVKDSHTDWATGTEVGRVWVVLSILGEGFAEGSGTLATITFKSTAPGETTLNLSTETVTCDPQWIPHTDVNGHVTVSADPADPPNPHNPHPPSNPDVNSDGVVDVLDVVTVAKAFGSKPGDSNWSSTADLNYDDKVDIFDVILIAQNLNQS